MDNSGTNSSSAGSLPGAAMLTWEDGIPCFTDPQSKWYPRGDYLSLRFGWYTDSMLDISSCYYILLIVQDGINWQIDYYVQVVKELEQRPKVDELVFEINVALKERRNYHLAEYLAYWEGQDPDFQYAVYASQKSPTYKEILTRLTRD